MKKLTLMLLLAVAIESDAGKASPSAEYTVPALRQKVQPGTTITAAAIVAADGTTSEAAQQAAASAPRAQTPAFTPGKTPWGDPDLQGDYSNKYEYGTPFERPQEFEGRRLEDVTATELADAVKKRQENITTARLSSQFD